MTDAALLLAATFAYLLATIVFGVYLLRFATRFGEVATAVLVLGAALHAAAIVARVAAGHMAMATYDLVLVLSFAAVGLHLAWQIRRHSPLRGALFTPVLTMVAYGLHVFDYEEGLVFSAPIEVVTPIHVAASTLGFLVLGVSAGASVLAVVQEHRLKSKRPTIGEKGRLPSLRALESAAHTALLAGFPLYSLGMALGATWFLQGDSATVSRHFAVAAASWLLWAFVLHARVVVGLRGRRAAILTLAAFVVTLFVPVLSMLRIAT